MPHRTILATLAFIAATPAAAQGSAERGATVAEQWCSNCHIAEGKGSDAVMPLATAARGRDDAWLRTFLTKPHGKMPDLSLSQREVEDLVAYLNTLRT